MTSLPLVWGEGGLGDILAQGDKSPVLTVIESIAPVDPVDVIDADMLARHRVLMLAQPRRLAPQELVALDGWVRSGGLLLMLADPMLVWPSNYPLGDNRRPVPVSLLDPLLDHWGLTLGNAKAGGEAKRVVAIFGEKVVTMRPGSWSRLGPTCRKDGIVATCRIGQGSVIAVADADWLDARVWTHVDGGNALALKSLIKDAVKQNK